MGRDLPENQVTVLAVFLFAAMTKQRDFSPKLFGKIFACPLTCPI